MKRKKTVFNESQRLSAAYYIPPLGWDSFAIRLYFREDFPDRFVPVYPTREGVAAAVKLWEIRYPSDIKPDPKYRSTRFPEIDSLSGTPSEI